MSKKKSFNVIQIIRSRFKKSEDHEVKRKRAICKKCEFNSKNTEIKSKKQKFLKFLSDSLSFITFNKDTDNLGNCLACDVCSIYYKTIDEEECPHPKKDLWKLKK